MPAATAHAATAIGVLTLVAATLAGGCAEGLTSADRALLTAARRGDVRAIERALAAGAAVDARDGYGQTPLMRAAAFGHAAAVTVL